MFKAALIGIVFATLLLPTTAGAQGGDDCSPREQKLGACDDPSQGAGGTEQDTTEERCGNLKQGEQCGEGNGRQTAGGQGTGKVSHAGWPPITGVLWKVLEEGRGSHQRTGTEDN